MNEEEILDMFHRTGVIIAGGSGHYATREGFHSATLIRVGKALQFPPFNRKLAFEIVRHFLELDIHVVAAASSESIPAAVEIGRQLEARTIFADPADGTRLYDGFMIHAGERVVIVQSLLRNDQGLEPLKRLVRKADARLIGVGSIVDVRESRSSFTIRDVTAIRLPWEYFPAGDCPLCAAGSPVIDA